MTEDSTRATARPVEAGAPVHGLVGPADPHADPATHPGLRPVDRPVGDSPTVPTPAGQTGVAGGLTPTRTSWVWIGLILSALVLLFLLIFILQNDEPVRVTFLGLSGTLPTGVALLLAAIAGLLLVAIPGGLRILQLRRVARRGGRPTP